MFLVIQNLQLIIIGAVSLHCALAKSVPGIAAQHGSVIQYALNLLLTGFVALNLLCQPASNSINADFTGS